MNPWHLTSTRGAAAGRFWSNAAKQKRATFYRAKYNKLKYKLGSANKAKVAIANRMARATYKIIAGDKFKELGYGRAKEHEDKIEILINQLKALGVNIRHEGHEKIVSVRKLKIDSTGVQLA